ncbi:MAG: two-component sensor histidine kinase, partial [Gemmatimonadetes bacterium]|nr:two-component sensor histidine kinase [Gemmatimonadota bacterium]
EVRPPQRRPPGGNAPPPPPEGRTGARREREPRDANWHVVEFDPLAADVLAGGRRSLGLSVLASLLLVSLAVLSWRASERSEAARRAMEEQQHLADLGQMSAVLAHEIRNPLASLKGNAQLVAEKLPAGSPGRKQVDRVVSEANRLEALTRDLLDFARTGPLQRSDADPLEMVRQLVEDVGGGPFEIESAGAARTWALDVARIRQALLNVLMNAREASGSGPVRVRVEQAPGSLVFEISDSGAGLPAGEEARIFDPFFTTRTNGTGLGLAVARSVVEKHGGRIGAANRPGGGAVFRIVLPASESA